MRRWILLAAALLVAAGAWAAGSGEEGAAGGEPLDYVIFEWGPRDVHEEDGVVAALSEKFGIDLTVERILAREYNQALETRIAAGDVPDLFRLRNNNIYATLRDDGVLVNWSELADELSLPHVKNWLQSEGIEGYSENGVFYRLPSRKGPSKTAIMIRSDWLEGLGLDMPRDYDEFRAVLQAFVDAQPDGTSTTGITGYTTWVHWEHILTGFTGMNNWGKVDGRWVYEKTTAQYRDGLRYLAGLYADGLMDREAFILDETQAKAKLVSGQAGAFIIMNDREPPLNTAVKERMADAHLAFLIPPPAGPAGRFRPESPGFSGYMLVMNTKSDARVAMAGQIMDYFHSPEGQELLTFGVEGVHWNEENDKKVFTELHERDIIPTLGHMLNMTADYSTIHATFEGQQYDNYLASLEYGVFDPTQTLASETSQRVTTNIGEFLGEWFVAFVTGEKSLDDDWDDYLALMERAGLPELTEEVNNYLAALGM